MAFSFDESKSNLKNDMLRDGATLLLLTALWICLGFLALTAGRGLEESLNLTKWTVFAVLIATFGVTFFSLKLIKFYGGLKKVHVFIHDPEKGLFANVGFVKNPATFIYFMLILTLVMALVGSLTPQSSLGNLFFPLKAGLTPEQVTAGGKVFFGVFNAPAEDFFRFLFEIILVSFEFWLFYKLWKLPVGKTYVYLIIPNIIITGIVWLWIHSLVAADNSLRQISHIFFGIESAALDFSTGSIIPSSILHIVNNLFVTIRTEFGNVWIPIIISILIFIMIVIGVIYSQRKSKNQISEG